MKAWRRRLRRLIAVIIAATCGTAVASAARGPYIAKDAIGYDRCIPSDVAYPCPGRLLTVRNPLPRVVEVTIRCGDDLLLDTTAVIPKHGTVIVDLGTDVKGGLPAGACYLQRWRLWP